MDDAASTGPDRRRLPAGGEKGWRSVSVAAAARAAGLPLARARERFPGRAAILLRFGRQADQSALADVPSEGPARDRLFDLLMRRIDALQAHRAGVLALLRALPADPRDRAAADAGHAKRSMRWMLEAAGIPTRGVRGELRVKGLLAVWLWTIRAWRSRRERGPVGDDGGARHGAAPRRAARPSGWAGTARAAAVPPEATSRRQEPTSRTPDPAA